MAIQLDGATATIARVTPRHVRHSALLFAPACLLLGWPALLYVTAWWLKALGGLAILVAVLALVLSLVPDRWIVFDAGARVVTTTRQYPWQLQGHSNTVPFSEVDSLGVTRKSNDEAPDDYNVVLRLQSGRTITLWTLAVPSTADREVSQFIAAEPNLLALRRLTGFRYANRLD